MNKFIARPEVFFREVHPESAKGRIVLERATKNKKRHSLVSTCDAEKIVRLSCKVPDIYYSVASFSGMPLLLNFENTRCLYLRFKWTPYIKAKLYNALDSMSFPYPTAVVTDGEKLTFFWMLENVITRAEYYKVFLLQCSLLRSVSILSPCKDSLEINSLTPLIGTVNSRINGYVALISYNDEPICNKVFENLLLRGINISNYENFKIHSRAILELLSLFGERFMDVSSAYEDWLIFFGASLCHFCTEVQLAKELRAIAVSLEGKHWSVIKEKYEKLVNSIASCAIKGFISYSGQNLDLDRPDWFNLVSGKLNVTHEEVKRLGLNVLADRDSGIINSGFDIANIKPVGDFEFVPLERLMIKAVA